jgi:probable HAF family extracellular repeat protein
MRAIRLIVLAAALAASSHAVAQKYTVSVIEGLPGSMETYIGGFNARNQLLGHSRFAGGARKGFIYQEGVYTELPSIGGETLLGDVNDHGVVVGAAKDAKGTPRAFVWTEELGMRLLFDEADGPTSANGINSRGDIIGTIGDDPFLLEDGVLTMLPRYYGPFSHCTVRDLNEDGTIVGTNLPPMSEGTMAVRWVKGQIEPLSGGFSSYPAEINDSGQIAGYYRTFYPNSQQPVTWINGVRQELPTLVGRGFAFGLNSRGDIVGQALDRNWQSSGACAWVNGQFLVLQQFVNPTEWTLISASDIDERGRITGYGWYQTPLNVRGYVLAPVDGRR